LYQILRLDDLKPAFGERFFFEDELETKYTKTV